jgi:hypothetical protein
LIALPLQRQHRLRRQAQLVRDGHADAAVADVEAEIADSFQLLAPSLTAVSHPFHKICCTWNLNPPYLIP